MFLIKLDKNVLRLCAVLVASAASAEVLAQTSPIRTDRSFDASFKSMAREKSKAAEQETPVAGVVVAPGTRYYAGAALLHGYDSNVDLDTTGRQSSSFGLLDLGAGLLFQRGNSETAIVARGSFSYYDIDFRPERWDAGGLVDHHVKIDDAWRATIGGFFIADQIDISRNNRTAGYVELNRDLPTHDMFLRIRTMNRDYLDRIGTTRTNGDLIEIDRTFSNTRTETSAGVLLAKDRFLAPYIQTGVAAIDFTKQANEQTLDRDGNEVWGVAGFRLTFAPQLYADVGGRVIHRDLDDRRVGEHTTGFFDGRIVWNPGDWLYAEINVDRTLEDPEATGALLTERTATQLYLKAWMSERLYAVVTSGYVRNEQVGVDRRFNDLYLDTRIGYAVSPKLEVFGIAGAARSKDSADVETADRFRVGLGVKFGY